MCSGGQNPRKRLQSTFKGISTSPVQLSTLLRKGEVRKNILLCVSREWKQISNRRLNFQKWPKIHNTISFDVFSPLQTLLVRFQQNAAKQNVSHMGRFSLKITWRFSTLFKKLGERETRGQAAEKHDVPLYIRVRVVKLNDLSPRGWVFFE